MKPKTVRCAIYTRKSTEHNLDLEFNSLHAQREACEAYIKSQLHEGWQLISDHYDDGAFSGASLDRPDLQRLLRDIASGQVDNVVVYKVDRLTRSLTDFARLVELFDKQEVSFVSVTQAFNTTTSMGRLTLNVLLSFAQFEREVIGERVRDKIAASKRKGLFMGGNIPLGYANRDKKLVIAPEEAERVRWIFQKYLELGSIGQLLEEMNRQNIRTKIVSLASGKDRGGVPYGKGALAYLLKNRCYVGEIRHNGQIYLGDHEAIIDRSTFDAVQASLDANLVARKAIAKASPFLLQGLIFDSVGNRMTPSHSRKKGVRYRYYVSQALLQSRNQQAGSVARVSAPEIEAEIEKFVRCRASDPRGDLFELVRAQLRRIEVHQEYLSLDLMRGGDHSQPESQSVKLARSASPFRALKGAIVGGESSADSVGDTVLAAIARSRTWVADLTNGISLIEISKREKKGQRHIRSLLPLAFIAPERLRAIIDGYIRSVNVAELARSVPIRW